MNLLRSAPLVALIAIVAGTLTGCGSSGSSIELQDGSDATGGKALFFKASTDERLAGSGGDFALELRGIDVAHKNATYDRPTYHDKVRCIVLPCEWTVAPDAASTYEFRAFLIDQRKNKPAGKSAPVEVDWAAPPRPHALELLVNGKSMPVIPLDGGDEYIDIPAGKLQVEAQWTTDARDTGYVVVISTAEPQDRVYARCSTGTSCLVPVKVPILVDQEVSWVVEVLTTRGGKVVTGGRVCLDGRAA